MSVPSTLSVLQHDFTETVSSNSVFIYREVSDHYLQPQDRGTLQTPCKQITWGLVKMQILILRVEKGPRGCWRVPRVVLKLLIHVPHLHPARKGFREENAGRCSFPFYREMCLPPLTRTVHCHLSLTGGGGGGVLAAEAQREASCTHLWERRGQGQRTLLSELPPPRLFSFLSTILWVPK